MNSLEEIAQLVRSCTDCPLHQGRTNAVPGEGSPDADIMFIGEAPGYQEDRQGRPFVGPAGHFLDELLASIGLSREQVYITNLVKSRPPQNRDPRPDEISACSKYLDRQTELIDPDLIVTLGRFSLARFFPGETISRAHGKLRQKDGRYVYPVMHPAAGLHRQELRSVITQDFKAIPEILESIQRSAGNVAGPPQEETPPPEQLALF